MHTLHIFFIAILLSPFFSEAGNASRSKKLLTSNNDTVITNLLEYTQYEISGINNRFDTTENRKRKIERLVHFLPPILSNKNDAYINSRVENILPQLSLNSPSESSITAQIRKKTPNSERIIILNNNKQIPLNCHPDDFISWSKFLEENPNSFVKNNQKYQDIYSLFLQADNKRYDARNHLLQKLPQSMLKDIKIFNLFDHVTHTITTIQKLHTKTKKSPKETKKLAHLIENLEELTPLIITKNHDYAAAYAKNMVKFFTMINNHSTQHLKKNKTSMNISLSCQFADPNDLKDIVAIQNAWYSDLYKEYMAAKYEKEKESIIAQKTNALDKKIALYHLFAYPDYISKKSNAREYLIRYAPHYPSHNKTIPHPSIKKILNINNIKK